MNSDSCMRIIEYVFLLLSEEDRKSCLNKLGHATGLYVYDSDEPIDPDPVLEVPTIPIFTLLRDHLPHDQWVDAFLRSWEQGQGDSVDIAVRFLVIKMRMDGTSQHVFDALKLAARELALTDQESFCVIRLSQIFHDTFFGLHNGLGLHVLHDEMAKWVHFTLQHISCLYPRLRTDIVKMMLTVTLFLHYRLEGSEPTLSRANAVLVACDEGQQVHSMMLARKTSNPIEVQEIMSEYRTPKKKRMSASSSVFVKTDEK